MYVVRLKKFSLQKVNNLTLVTFFTIGLVAPSTLIAKLLKFKEVMFCGGDLTLWLLCVPFLVHTRPLPANYVVRFGTHFTTDLDPLCTLYGHDFRSLQGDSR
jgi:hypothetical protein